jgi:hypothetical protein
VLNLGVIGVGNRQGLELIRQEALSFQPDLVIFAYGTNDRAWRHPITDDDLIRLNQSFVGGVILGVEKALDHLYLFRLLQHTIVAVLRTVETPSGLAGGVFRVPIEGISDAITRSQHLLAAQGVSLLVLNNDFVGTDSTVGIERGVQGNHIPYLNMKALLERVRAKRSLDIEKTRSLPRPHPSQGTFLMRVVSAGKPREVVLEFQERPDTTIAGSRRLAMRDDGKGEDRRLATTSGGPRARISGLANQLHLLGATRWEDGQGVRGALPDGDFDKARDVPASGVGEIDTFGDPCHSPTVHIRARKVTASSPKRSMTI